MSEASKADRPVVQGPWRAIQQEDGVGRSDGDWEVRAVINDQNHYVLIAFDLDEAVAKRIAAAPAMLAELMRLHAKHGEAATEAVITKATAVASAMERP